MFVISFNDTHRKTEQFSLFFLIVLINILSIVIMFFTSPAQAQLLSGSWESGSASGFTPRSALASCVINGEIYVLGGLNSGIILNTFEVFDPPSNSWSTPAAEGSFTPRAGHTASFVGGKIYLIGGVTNQDLLVNTIDVFDTQTKTWTSLTPSGYFPPRMGHCAAVVGNKIYVFGGDTQNFAYQPEIDKIVRVLDLSTNSWNSLVTTGQWIPPMYASSNVIGGKIYFEGGTDSIGNNSLSTLEIFDPSSNSWNIPQTTGSMTARSGLASAVIDSTIIVMGGYGASSDLSSTEAFDLLTNTWYTPSTSGNFTPRDEFCASQVNNMIYALGGENDVSVDLNTNEVFSVSEDIVSSSNFPNKNNLLSTISPNPVFIGNSVMVGGAGSYVSAEIVDEAGRVVCTLRTNENAPILQIPTQGLAAGVYNVVLFSSDGSMSSVKFVAE